MGIPAKTQDLLMEYQALVVCSANCTMEGYTCFEKLVEVHFEGGEIHVTRSMAIIMMDMQMDGKIGANCTMPDLNGVPEMNFHATGGGLGKV